MKVIELFRKMSVASIFPVATSMAAMGDTVP